MFPTFIIPEGVPWWFILIIIFIGLIFLTYFIKWLGGLGENEE